MQLNIQNVLYMLVLETLCKAGAKSSFATFTFSPEKVKVVFLGVRILQLCIRQFYNRLPLNLRQITNKTIFTKNIIKFVHKKTYNMHADVINDYKLLIKVAASAVEQSYQLLNKPWSVSVIVALRVYEDILITG